MQRRDSTHLVNRSSQPGRYSGIQTIVSQEYRSWKVAIERRQVGTTIKRVQFSVRLQDSSAARIEFLRGYSSRQQAIAAAHRRIDFIVDIQTPHQPRRRKRRPAYPKY